MKCVCVCVSVGVFAKNKWAVRVWLWIDIQMEKLTYSCLRKTGSFRSYEVITKDNIQKAGQEA